MSRFWSGFLAALVLASASFARAAVADPVVHDGAHHLRLRQAGDLDLPLAVWRSAVYKFLVP